MYSVSVTWFPAAVLSPEHNKGWQDEGQPPGCLLLFLFPYSAGLVDGVLQTGFSLEKARFGFVRAVKAEVEASFAACANHPVLVQAAHV